MNTNKVKIIYLALFMVAAVIITIAVKSPLEQNVCLNQQHIRTFDQGWRRIDTNELVEVGGRKQYKTTNDEFTIYRKLPHEIREEDNLLLSSSHSQIKIYIDGKKIFDYGEQKEGWLGAPGSAWLIVPLRSDYGGREIIITAASSIKKYKGRMNTLYITDRASALLFIIQQNQTGIMTGYMILTLGILLFIIWLICLPVYNITKLLYLALFSMILYTWSLGESAALQFSIGNMRGASIMSFELIIVLQFPMMLFFSIDEHNKVRPRLKKYLYIPIINFILCNYLFLVHRVDFTESIWVTHISLGLCSITSMYTIYNEKKKSSGNKLYSIKQWRLDSWGFVFMLFMALLDIIRYYTAYYSDSAMYSRFGLLFFILALGIQTINGSVKIMLEAQKNKIYKHMAYHDCLTQMYNRTAYEKKIHDLSKLNDQISNVCVLAVDINNLKYVNDTYGHASGDQYIVENANYCCELFADIADCYRTGGDEFIIICLDHIEAFEKRILLLEKDDYGKNNFAYGFAKFNAETDHSILELVARADKKMYENKEIYR